MFPIARGRLDYFPDALAEVAKLSYLGTSNTIRARRCTTRAAEHGSRGCIVRHLVGRGGFDGGMRESAALAWRSLALLQEELEAEFNLPLPRGAKKVT
jgi:hypothetical protein